MDAPANRTRARASLLLLAVLLAGAALGWLANEEFGRSGRDRKRGVEYYVQRLSDDLALSAAQQDSVRVILERRRADIDSLWADAHPRFETVRNRAHAEVERVLSDAQRVKYREGVEARRQKREARRAEKSR